MIDRTAQPTILSILSRLGISPGRHGRTYCPIHQGDNNQVFSYDDQKGRWFCFRCGIGGDAIELVKKALDIDFKGALQWLGIDSRPSVRNSKMTLITFSIRDRYRQSLERQRILRDEFRIRNIIEHHALKCLRINPDSVIGWNLLSAAYSRPGLDAIEYELDELLKEIPREAYPRKRAA